MVPAGLTIIVFLTGRGNLAPAPLMLGLLWFRQGPPIAHLVFADSALQPASHLGGNHPASGPP